MSNKKISRYAVSSSLVVATVQTVERHGRHQEIRGGNSKYRKTNILHFREVVCMDNIFFKNRTYRTIYQPASFWQLVVQKICCWQASDYFSVRKVQRFLKTSI